MNQDKLFSRLSIVHTYPHNEEESYLDEVEFFTDVVISPGEPSPFDLVKSKLYLIEHLETKLNVELDIAYEDNGDAFIHVICPTEIENILDVLEEISCTFIEELIKSGFEMIASGCLSQRMYLDASTKKTPLELSKLN